MWLERRWESDVGFANIHGVDIGLNKRVQL